ncbi:zinc finger and BTB domain-containing protein 7B-like [Cetorhinus maximus]
MGTAEDELIGIPFPEHSSELLNSLNEQRHKGVLCDVTIVTQGLEYRTHRAVLAACSQYFRKLFTSRSFSGQHNVCELDFVRPEVLAALLEFAYTATLTISNSNMREVLQAARLLEIQCVTDACIDILQSSGASDKPEPAAADDLTGYAKAKQYLDGFTEEITASSIDVIQMLDVPKFRHRKRPKKPPRVSLNNRRNLYRIVQPLRTSMNNVISAQPAEQPPDDSPVHLEDQYSGELSDQRSGCEERQEEYKDFSKKAEGFDYRPLSPAAAELHTDEESAEPDPATYLSSLSNGILSNSLALPDKLVRRRKSQMPQECPICHKVIHGAGKLPRHMRTHTGEKPFACEVCGVRFTRNDKLKIHMRKHTGERPYSCDCCDARFLHSYDLKNHARLHTGDRPFECSQCRKAFVRIDHLQRHLKGQNCLEIRTRKRKGDSRPGEDREVSWEHLGIDRAFPEEYGIKMESPGIDSEFPEEYGIRRESLGIDGAYPEEYGIRRESPGIDGAFSEEYGIRRESPGMEGTFPEEYGIRREPPQTDGKSDVDGSQDWGHTSTTWDHQSEERVLVDPS